MNDTDVLIIGGGISGLSTAWWLAQSGLSVEVWESAERPGGKIQSQQQNGYLTEQAASMVMNFRPEVVDLIRQAGLEDKKSTRSSHSEQHRYLLHQGQLTPIPMKMAALLVSPIWTLRGKLRMLAEPFIPSGNSEDETVSEFISRRLGREVLDKAIEPFVAGTLAGNPDLASAAGTLPRLTGLERRYGSIAAGILVNKLLRRRTGCVTETFSFQGGMSTLVETLAQAPGIRLRTGYAVESVTKTKDGWSITAQTRTGQRSLRVPQLIISTPAPAAAALLKPLDSKLSAILKDIQYTPLAVVHLGLDSKAVNHSLDGTGFLTPRSAGAPFTGNLWMSSLFSNRAPEGKLLLSSYIGGSRMPEAFDWDDGQAVDRIMGALRPLLGINGDPEMVHIDRHQQALPLYNGSYMERERNISEHLQRLPGLHLEANYRGGVSVRDRIARGRSLAKQVLLQHQQTQDGKIKLISPLLAPDY